MEKHTMENLNLYFQEWKGISRRFNEAFLPIKEAQEAMKKAWQPILDAQEGLQKALEPFARYHDSLKHVFEELQKGFRDLPPRTQEAILKLGDEGWFMDIEMPFPGLMELKKALENGNVKEAEDALVEYFEKRLEAIEKFVIEKFPNRGHLLRSAFNAHRRQEFELSIPVLWAQVDGICNEKFGQYYFRSKDKKPCTEIYVKQITADTFKAALFSPLANYLPINSPEKYRSRDFSGLNRHLVMHGESLDYGTKINSLKAISLVNYVSQLSNQNINL